MMEKEVKPIQVKRPLLEMDTWENWELYREALPKLVLHALVGPLRVNTLFEAPREAEVRMWDKYAAAIREWSRLLLDTEYESYHNLSRSKRMDWVLFNAPDYDCLQRAIEADKRYAKIVGEYVEVLTGFDASERSIRRSVWTQMEYLVTGERSRPNMPMVEAEDSLKVLEALGVQPASVEAVSESTLPHLLQEPWLPNVDEPKTEKLL